jgi:hypothetical protein
MKLLFLLLLSQTVELPRLGVIRDSQGALQTVTGIAGNFILRNEANRDIRSLAATNDLILSKTVESLVAADARGTQLAAYPTDDGPALFAFSPDGSAAAYLPAQRLLLLYKDAAWTVLNSDIDGNPNLLSFLRNKPTLAEDSETILALPQATLKRTDSTLTLAAACCETKPIDLPEPLLSAEQMATDWIHLRTASSSYALHLTASGYDLFQLPLSGGDQQ